MKNIFRILLVIGLLTTACACSDRDMPYKPEASDFFVEFEGGTNTITNEGGSLNITIKAGTNGWWVTQSENSSWCVINKKYGAGDYTLPVKIEKNETGASRSVNVVIHSTYDLPAVELTIQQDK